MGLRERVTLFLAVFALTQIACGHCMPRTSRKASLKRYLNDFKPVKDTPLPTPYSPPRINKTPKGTIGKPTQNDNIGENYFPNESLFKKYKFPENEYPLDTSPKDPFDFELSSNTNYQAPQKINFQNDMKKRMKMKRKLLMSKQTNNKYNQQNIGTCPIKFVSGSDSIRLLDSNTFPEMQYPLNTMDTWGRNYWNYLPFTEKKEVREFLPQTFNPKVNNKPLTRGKAKNFLQTYDRLKEEKRVSTENSKRNAGQSGSNFTKTHTCEKVSEDFITASMLPSSHTVPKQYVPIPYKVIEENNKNISPKPERRNKTNDFDSSDLAQTIKFIKELLLDDDTNLSVSPENSSKDNKNPTAPKDIVLNDLLSPSKDYSTTVRDPFNVKTPLPLSESIIQEISKVPGATSIIIIPINNDAVGESQSQMTQEQPFTVHVPSKSTDISHTPSFNEYAPSPLEETEPNDQSHNVISNTAPLVNDNPPLSTLVSDLPSGISNESLLPISETLPENSMCYNTEFSLSPVREKSFPDQLTNESLTKGDSTSGSKMVEADADNSSDSLQQPVHETAPLTSIDTTSSLANQSLSDTIVYLSSPENNLISLTETETLCDNDNLVIPISNVDITRAKYCPTSAMLLTKNDMPSKMDIVIPDFLELANNDLPIIEHETFTSDAISDLPKPINDAISPTSLSEGHNVLIPVADHLSVSDKIVGNPETVPSILPTNNIVTPNVISLDSYPAIADVHEPISIGDSLPPINGEILEKPFTDIEHQLILLDQLPMQDDVTSLNPSVPVISDISPLLSTQDSKINTEDKMKKNHEELSENPDTIHDNPPAPIDNMNPLPDDTLDNNNFPSEKSEPTLPLAIEGPTGLLPPLDEVMPDSDTVNDNEAPNKQSYSENPTDGIYDSPSENKNRLLENEISPELSSPITTLENVMRDIETKDFATPVAENDPITSLPQFDGMIDFIESPQSDITKDSISPIDNTLENTKVPDIPTDNVAFPKIDDNVHPLPTEQVFVDNPILDSIPTNDVSVDQIPKDILKDRVEDAATKPTVNNPTNNLHHQLDKNLFMSPSLEHPLPPSKRHLAPKIQITKRLLEKLYADIQAENITVDDLLTSPSKSFSI